MPISLSSKTHTLTFRLIAPLLGVLLIMLVQGGIALYFAQNTLVRVLIMGISGVGLVFALLGGRYLLRSIDTPLKRAFQEAQRLANGDFSQPLRVTRPDTIGDMQQVMYSHGDILRRMSADVEMLMNACMAGKLSTRADVSGYTGAFAQMIGNLNTALDTVVTPLHLATKYINNISTGDLPDRVIEEYHGDFLPMMQGLNKLIDTMNEVTWLAVMLAGGTLDVDATERSEHDRLMKALNLMIKQLNAMTAEMESLIHAIQEGNLSTRINADIFTGSWRTLVEGMNQVIDALVDPFTMVATCIDRIADGDIPEPITTEYNGDFNTIKENLNLLIASMHDITRVAEAIANGNLDIDVRERSEHDRLMKALNAMIQRLNTILNEMEALIHAVQEGDLDIRGHAETFAGGWQALVVGINNVIDALVIPIHLTAKCLDHISKGDLPEPITQEYTGDFNTIKQSLNRLIGTMHDITRLAEDIASGNLEVEITERSEHDRLMIALNAMIRRLGRFSQEMDELVHAVQEGNLTVRGKTDIFSGGWQKLVVGVNTLIDAFVAPITVAAAVIDQIAQGDIPQPITEKYQGDFNTIKQNLNLLIEATLEVTQLAKAIADGNLNIEVQERSERDTLMQALNAMTQRMQAVVTNVTSAANNVAAGSQELNIIAETMSQGAAQQAAATEEVSSAMEEMTANISQNADNARQTETIASQSAKYAKEGGDVVAQTVIAIQQIAHKITIIEEIADQTRFLSLNAKIEASRAQDHGKAFSVVAAEVRQLSEVTKQAAEEIKQLATSSVHVAEEAGKMLSTLVPSSHKTAELVQEITLASSEQRDSAEHINVAIQRLDQVTQQNVLTAEEVVEAAKELAIQGRRLQDVITFFKIGGRAPVPSHEKQKASATPVRQIPLPGQHKNKHEHQNRFPHQDEEDEIPPGTIINMEQSESETDDLDAEFERYQS